MKKRSNETVPLPSINKSRQKAVSAPQGGAPIRRRDRATGRRQCLGLPWTHVTLEWTSSDGGTSSGGIACSWARSAEMLRGAGRCVMPDQP